MVDLNTDRELGVSLAEKIGMLEFFLQFSSFIAAALREDASSEETSLLAS